MYIFLISICSLSKMGFNNDIHKLCHNRSNGKEPKKGGGNTTLMVIIKGIWDHLGQDSWSEMLVGTLLPWVLNVFKMELTMWLKLKRLFFAIRDLKKPGVTKLHVEGHSLIIVRNIGLVGTWICRLCVVLMTGFVIDDNICLWVHGRQRFCISQRIIGKVKLAHNRICYASLGLCSRMSVDVTSMFAWVMIIIGWVWVHLVKTGCRPVYKKYWQTQMLAYWLYLIIQDGIKGSELRW